jgi:hypothetical protein
MFFGIIKKAHPYHVGSMELKYNVESKTFEITGRFFLDDLESAINKKHGKSLHFNDPKFKAQMKPALEAYCLEYLKLKVNNEFVKVKFVGYEEDKESVDVFLETEIVQNPKKVEVSMSYLYNFFNDQINIIHVIVNDERKSEKLTYPTRYLYQQF